jgi:hypothetical protein
MASDFPAAHSMDTDWFAADADGHVGVFATGENGHAPADLREQMYVSVEEARAQGYFFFEYREDSELIDVYDRRLVPDKPAHVDQLPPQVRALAKRARLPVSFAAAEHVQPLEYLECQFWGEGGPAYVAGDGVTVRPRPGREDEYADFVRQFREWHPELVDRYRFEGLADGR